MYIRKRTDGQFEYWFEFESRCLRRSVSGRFRFCDVVPEDAVQVKPGEELMKTTCMHNSFIGASLKGVFEDDGFEWVGIQINNPYPNVPNVGLNETQIKQLIDSQDDGIVGIYEGFSGSKYKLACIKDGNDYKLIYMGSQEPLNQWHSGDVKAVLRTSATPGFFKMSWYMADKTINNDAYVMFEGGSMKVVIDNDEEGYLKMYPTSSFTNNPSVLQEWSGTGFALKGGYVVTNYHVIENAKSISIQGVNGDFDKQYNATIVATDKYNDLALLQITDNSFNGFGTIPYSVKTTVSEVGEDIFVLGYPLTSTMGDEIKLTTGVISSKTGFQGDVSLYQISAPIQPGNSGGPLFDNKGNLVGIVNAKHKGAENVGYAIKTSYLKNLIESSISTSILPNNNQTAGLPLTGKVKSLKNYVFMISCSNQEVNHKESSKVNNYANNGQQTYNQPNSFVESQ
jgi:S1-C subfamily serine protease